ncbi:MAG: hypothetical protein AVDCRST_MAG89-2694 [uncultured Gemmatimonadetes bacterium]|uniref:Uncharacterized protein n=1 Tax=uncultured Gemmatimonadota bacterium TaxID=203437 RepID=A0A6J4LV02_9BACT|nr:MAG: hypothetical protein AVDCRST_MAG89-2694 [uncultured Gemmatimonadota bacterium]
MSNEQQRAIFWRKARASPRRAQATVAREETQRSGRLAGLDLAELANADA